jgi:hypothetical protein
MELFLNELSAMPLAGNRYQAIIRMEHFAHAFKKAKEKGFTVIRSSSPVNGIMLAEEYSFHCWFNDRVVSKELKDYLYGIITLPFISEADEKIEDDYLAAGYYFEDIEYNIERQECQGLAAAYLYRLPAISFQSSDAWTRVKLPIIIVNNEQETEGCVFNIFEESSLEKKDIQVLIEERSTPELVKTEVLPTDKKGHFSPHHGKEELKAMWENLKKSPFVIGAQSTSWGGNHFIRRCFADGIVEIVLYTTPRKYAMRVQTTGRNMNETKAIALILEEKYS